MTGFRVDNFRGETPVANHRKLAEGAARIAYDCDLVGTDVRPFRTMSLIGSISSVGSPISGFVFNATQMFIFSADVDATYGPIQAAEDVKNKVYIGSGFQAFPVYSTKEIGLPSPGATYYGPPVAWRKLGVPPPDTVPVVTVSAIPGGNLTGIAQATVLGKVQMVATSDTGGNPAYDHGLVDGDRVVISGLASTWSDVSGQTYTITRITPTTFYLNNYDLTLHTGAPVSGAGAWKKDFNTEDVEDRLYIFTFVSDQGEEGPPSEPSTLASLGKGQSATIATSTSPSVDGAIVAFKRIYRTLPTSTGEADYYFVVEIPITQPTYVDTLEPIQLGERCPSIDWDPPPAGLKGLTVLPNGIMAGFVDRTLYLSEPYQPHAWPNTYTKKMDHEIVALAAFAQSLVVATKENPYVGTATDPLSMTLSKLESVEPCIAKRACKTLGYGVVYPSPNGLILVTPSGAKNVLAGIWEERDWRSIMTGNGTPFAEAHDGRYYLLFSGGYGLVFDPEAEGLEISHLTISSTVGMAVDRDEDKLYMLRTSGGAKVHQWNPDGGSTFIQARWRSKTFVMPYPVNMGAFQVFFDTAGSVTVEVFADGVSKYVTTVTSQEPQRLPSGFLALEWMFEVRSTVEIQSIWFAETMAELRGAFAR